MVQNIRPHALQRVSHLHKDKHQNQDFTADVMLSHIFSLWKRQADAINTTTNPRKQHGVGTRHTRRCSNTKRTKDANITLEIAKAAQSAVRSQGHQKTATLPRMKMRIKTTRKTPRTRMNLNSLARKHTVTKDKPTKAASTPKAAAAAKKFKPTADVGKAKLCSIQSQAVHTDQKDSGGFSKRD